MRLLLLFLTLLKWRGSSGVPVWNQKPAQYLQGSSLQSSLGDQLPYFGVSANSVQVASSSVSAQAQSGSSGQADGLSGQLVGPVSQSESSGTAVSLQQGSVGISLGASDHYTTQSFSSAPQVTGTLNLLPQAFQSSASSQGVSSVPASVSEQQGNAQSSSGSSWFGHGGSSSQGPHAPVAQTSSFVSPTFQDLGSPSMIVQASPQIVRVTPLASQQQGFKLSAGGSSGPAVFGQGVLPHQNALVSHVQPFQSSGPQTQVAQATPQEVAATVSPSNSQQQSFNLPVTGPFQFVSLGHGVPPSLGQNAPISRVKPIRVSQATPQGVAATVSPLNSEQQNFNLPTSGPSQFGSIGQEVPSSQGQNAPRSPTVLSSGLQTQVTLASSQRAESVSEAGSQQPSFEQSAVVWLALEIKDGQIPTSTTGQLQLPRPVPASGSSNLYTAQGISRVQPSGSNSWNTPPQRSSSVPTLLQPSQTTPGVPPAQVSSSSAVTTIAQSARTPVIPQGVPLVETTQNPAEGSKMTGSSGLIKWFKVTPPGFAPAWNSVKPYGWVQANNNPYASLSQVAVPSADSIFHSSGPSSALQMSSISRSSTAGSLIPGQTSGVPASVLPSQLLPSGLLPSQNLNVSTQGTLTWQPTGPTQTVLPGSASTAQLKPNGNSPSNVSKLFPGGTSSFSFVQSQKSQANMQNFAVRFPFNQQNASVPGT